ncbi:MAG: hypothetical protein QM786_09100 [Breznakibacter sp.]
MTYFKRHISRGVGFLMLLLFTGYYGGITMFYHSHVVNGRVITHSHPYKKTANDNASFPGHSHGKGEFVLLKYFHQTGFQQPLKPNVPPPTFCCIFVVAYPDNDPISSAPTGISRLRAPPAFNVFSESMA